MDSKMMKCQSCSGDYGKSRHALGVTKYRNHDCFDMPLDVDYACENCGEFYPYHKRHPMRRWLKMKIAQFKREYPELVNHPELTNKPPQSVGEEK